MKIIFFGTPDFATLPLQALITGGYSLVAVITQPDSVVGRKKVPISPPVKTTSQSYNIPVLQPDILKSDSFFEVFKNLDPDICIIGGYGKIIPKRYIDVPRFGFLCIHPSLLPEYRGPSPIQGAILNGELETGVTIIIIDSEMDHGPILSSEKYILRPDIFKEEAEKEIWDLGAKLLLDTMPKYVGGEIKPREQDHSQATFTKLLNREDGRIDWSRPHKEIYNQIRALNPEPGTWTTWNDKILNIKTASFAKATEGHNEQLKLLTVQLEGKKETSMTDFLSGHPDFNISQLK